MNVNAPQSYDVVVAGGGIVGAQPAHWPARKQD
jgi:glycine/D-amino acid oxidase-like deaminating enzyme